MRSRAHLLSVYRLVPTFSSPQGWKVLFFPYFRWCQFFASFYASFYSSFHHLTAKQPSVCPPTYTLTEYSALAFYSIFISISFSSLFFSCLPRRCWREKCLNKFICNIHSIHKADAAAYAVSFWNTCCDDENEYFLCHHDFFLCTKWSEVDGKCFYFFVVVAIVVIAL